MITLYWKNAISRIVGEENGVSPADLAELEPVLAAAHQKVVAQCREGKLGYAQLPSGRPQYAASVKTLVEKYKHNTTDMVVLGIGGSALGNVAMHSALNPSTWNLLSPRKRKGPRFFVLDNVDPSMISDVLKFVGRRLNTTLFNVISKSGETAETASQFMIIRKMLQDKLGSRFNERIVATTDAQKGTLHTIAKQDGYDMLEVPGDVGGRFSVLSPVGLFSGAMCNVDIDELLAGADAMRQRVEVMDLMQNPAAILAALKYLMFAKKGKPMHVMMPYSNRLYMMADWYRQIWAESLGKQYDTAGNEIFTGPTPIKALGATDQHSQVQLYREGPNDKFTMFIDVKKHPKDIRVPDAFADVEGLAYLRKARISKLLSAEKKATEYAMAVSQRPTVTLTLPEINARSIGEFFYLFEFVTSLVGEMLNINTYDQPAVELGKQATFALMGREGYADIAKAVKPYQRTDKKYLA